MLCIQWIQWLVLRWSVPPAEFVGKRHRGKGVGSGAYPMSSSVSLRRGRRGVAAAAAHLGGVGGERDVAKKSETRMTK
jgi:hypothetical protein